MKIISEDDKPEYTRRWSLSLRLPNLLKIFEHKTQVETILIRYDSSILS